MSLDRRNVAAEVSGVLDSVYVEYVRCDHAGCTASVRREGHENAQQAAHEQGWCYVGDDTDYCLQHARGRSQEGGR